MKLNSFLMTFFLSLLISTSAFTKETEKKSKVRKVFEVALEMDRLLDQDKGKKVLDPLRAKRYKKLQDEIHNLMHKMPEFNFGENPTVVGPFVDKDKVEKGIQYGDFTQAHLFFWSKKAESRLAAKDILPVLFDTKGNPILKMPAKDWDLMKEHRAYFMEVLTGITHLFNNPSNENILAILKYKKHLQVFLAKLDQTSCKINKKARGNKSHQKFAEYCGMMQELDRKIKSLRDNLHTLDANISDLVSNGHEFSKCAIKATAHLGEDIKIKKEIARVCAKIEKAYSGKNVITDKEKHDLYQNFIKLGHLVDVIPVDGNNINDVKRLQESTVKSILENKYRPVNIIRTNKL